MATFGNLLEIPDPQSVLISDFQFFPSFQEKSLTVPFYPTPRRTLFIRQGMGEFPAPIIGDRTTHDPEFTQHLLELVAEIAFHLRVSKVADTMHWITKPKKNLRGRK